MSSSSGREDADPNVSGFGNGSTSPQGSVTSVKVAVRVRPLIALERGQGCQGVIFGNSEDNQVLTGDNRCFHFDHVFGMDSTQEEVYRHTTFPLVERCLEGFNATVLAYGQTGSGKTWTVGNAYTVNGAPEDAGIIPRAVIDIFKRVDELRAQGSKASVRASFLEVINEEIRDLVGGGGADCPGNVSGTKDGGGLPLRENLQGEIIVAGLSQHEISGPEDLGSLLERGALCRATARTNMNAHSSRSHAICTLTFEVVRPATVEAEETATSSRFHLVDLAGSERAKKTGAEGQRLREGININKGLLALGNVISALSEAGTAVTAVAAAAGHHVHVPYRDSKLTRLLQSSLGGNAHTVMIACISPADSNMAESINTLRYAGRAMKIKNTAIKNEGTSGPPVSFAEVAALRKEVRILQVELMQARLSGMGNFGFSGRASPDDDGSCGGRGGGPSESAAVKEATELRRAKVALERRVLDTTRHATQAVEREMCARLESDRWRLRCEQVLAILKEAAPQSFGGLPRWAKETEPDAVAGVAGKKSESSPEAGSSSVCGGDEAAAGSASTSSDTTGSLERELRQRVFELEAQVFELEGRIVLAGGDAKRRLANRVGGSDGTAIMRTDSASTLAKGLDEDEDELLGEGLGEEGAEGDTDEIRRVDQEIEDKERELLLKAEQARAYEAMKGQFEGLLGRLQGEVSSLQSERDALLLKLSSTSATAAGGIGSSSASRGSRTGGNKSEGSAALVRMKTRIAELEARIKENRKKVAEHQRAERERAAAAKEVERLRTEVGEAKHRRAELQRVHREASTRFMKETRQHQLKEVRMRRDGQRMQWQVKKLQESHEKTQAALKRKMEEHSIAMRKMRKLQSQNPQGVRGGGDGVGSGGVGGNSAMREAKKAELSTWLASEIEEATAVQRAKRALKAQLKLRAEAARRAQLLRDQGQAEWSGAKQNEREAREGSGGDLAERGELEDLEERVATTSKMIQSLQSFLVSADRNSSATGTRTASGMSPPSTAVGLRHARWSRLRTPWDNKTALSLLLGEAVKAKVLGLDFAEASSLKDVEIRDLSREMASLRSAGPTGSYVDRAATMQAALAEAEAEVMAAVGSEVEKKVKVEEDAAKSGGVVENEAVEEREYEREERSFIEVSDSEDEEEDFEDDDKDEDWLPDGAAAVRKRSSTQSVVVTEAPSLKNGPEDEEGEEATGDTEVPGDDHASAMGVTGRVEGLGDCQGDSQDRGGGSAHSKSDRDRDDRSSSGSASWELSVWEIDWDNLASHTVVQLKALLRKHSLPVTGKKDVLIERIKTSLLANRPSTSMSRRSCRSSVSSSSSSSLSYVGGKEDTSAAAANDSKKAWKGRQAQGGDDTGVALSTPDIGSENGSESRNGSGLQHQESLRERLKARVRATSVKREEGSAAVGKRQDDAAAGRSSSEETQRGVPPPTSQNKFAAQHARGVAGSSSRSPSPTEASSMSHGAVNQMEHPPAGRRKPLGALSQGSLRVGSNRRGAPDSTSSKRNSSKPGVTASMQTNKSSALDGDISSDGDVHARPAFATSASGTERPTPATASAEKHQSDDVASNGTKFELTRLSSALGGGRHGSADGKDEGARHIVKPSQVNIARRVKVKAKKNGAVKSTTGIRSVPSFLKPTKSSGAHTSALVRARSGESSGSGTNRGGVAS